CPKIPNCGSWTAVYQTSDSPSGSVRRPLFAGGKWPNYHDGAVNVDGRLSPIVKRALVMTQLLDASIGLALLSVTVLSPIAQTSQAGEILAGQSDLQPLTKAANIADPFSETSHSNPEPSAPTPSLSRVPPAKLRYQMEVDNLEHLLQLR